MKTFRTHESGSAMIVVAIFALVVAGTLLSYLVLVSGENQMVYRSQNWNNALNVAEAGTEEAMALLNVNIGQANQSTNWTTYATTNGWDTANQSTEQAMTWLYNGASQTWATTNGTIYHLKRWLDPTNGYYDVYIHYDPASTNGPEILSVGSAKWNNVGGSSGDSNVVVNIKNNAVRKVYIKTLNSGQMGANGLVAYMLDFKGNNVTIDSFNSADPAHSIWNTNLWFHGTNYGTWSSTLSYNSNSPPSRTANVVVATETNYINVGNANIYGYVDTTPGGTEAIGPNGSVGDLNWVHNNTSGIQSGHGRDDMNQTFTSLSLPTSFSNSVQTNNWLPIPSPGSGQVIIIGGTWTNIAGVWTNRGGTFYTNSSGFSLPNGDGTYSSYSLVITNRPQATNNIYYAYGSLSGRLFVDAPYSVLYVTNGMSSPVITINTNADLFIYSGGNISFGTTMNNTALARALTIVDILGKPISITASGNASGVSKIYAPSSTVKFSGGGNNTYDIIGEICALSSTFNGHFNLHYDESLATNTPTVQFVGTLWREVQ